MILTDVRIFGGKTLKVDNSNFLITDAACIDEDNVHM